MVISTSCWWKTGLPALAEQHQYWAGCPVSPCPFAMLWPSFGCPLPAGACRRTTGQTVCRGLTCCAGLCTTVAKASSTATTGITWSPTSTASWRNPECSSLVSKKSPSAPSCLNNSSEQQLSACHTRVTDWRWPHHCLLCFISVSKACKLPFLLRNEICNKATCWVGGGVFLLLCLI